MTKRERLEAKRKSNFDKIEDLKKQNIELAKELCLLSDEKQWFTEKEEEHVISKRPKKTETFLVGRIHWNEFLKDESYPDDESEGVWIERSQVVRVNEKWL